MTAKRHAVPAKGWRKLLARSAAGVMISLAPIAAAAKRPYPGPASPVEVSNGPSPGSLEIRATRPTALAPELIVERQRPDRRTTSFAILTSPPCI